MQTQPHSSLQNASGRDVSQPSRLTRLNPSAGLTAQAAPPPKFMKTTNRLLSLLIALICLATSWQGRAANIVWVSDQPNVHPSLVGTPAFWSSPIQGVTDDVFVIMLQNAGHNVVRFTSDDNGATLLTAAQIADLNTNDLIIVGRATGSGFTSGNQGVQWNTAITKPVIVQSPFLTRTANLGFFTGATALNGVPGPLVATTPTDPETGYLFSLFGTTFANGSISASNYDFTLEQSTSQTTDNPVAGANLLATGWGTNKVIVELPSGTAVRGGNLAGYRLYFASGNREASSLTTAGNNNLTPTGVTLFLRAVNLALNNGVAPNLGAAPVLTTSPAGAYSVCTRTPLTLTSAATGENPLYFQWFSNDVAIPFGTNAVLTFAPDDASAGNYVVVVSNAVAGLTAVTSAPAVVTITGIGTTNSIVANQTVCPNSPATFTTTADGPGTLYYTWRKDGAIVQDPAVNNSSTFTIASVSPADGGTYSVSVLGDCNTSSNNFTLTVVAPPVITVQPRNQNTPMGNGAVFTVTATAAQAITYQWQINGVDAIDGANVTGATTPIFAVSNLTLLDSGKTVSVVATSCGGSTPSTAALLTVTPISGISFDFNSPLQFTNTPYYMVYNDWISSSLQTPVTVAESPIGGVGPFPGSGSLDLIPNNGTVNSAFLLPVSFDFSLPGKTLTASAMVKIKTPVNNNRNTQIAFCTSTNGDLDNNVDRVYMSAILQATAQPALTYQIRTGNKPTAANAFQEGNNSANLTLVVSNWYRLTATFVNTPTAVPGTYTATVTLDHMGTDGLASPSTLATIGGVTITNVNATSARNLYFVVRGIENCGIEAWDNFHASTTTGDIAFVQQPQNQTVLQGRRATFKALVDGSGPYTYQWMKDGSPIAGATSWKYMTPPVAAADAGSYSVTVTGTTFPEDSSAATLTVAPDPLVVVGAGSVDGTTVGVEFNQPVDLISAGNPASYLINGAAPVAARVYKTSVGPMGPGGIYVILTPATILAADFTLSAPGVKDLGGNAIGTATSPSGFFAGMTGVDINPLATAPQGENYCFGPGKFIVMGGGADISSTADQARYVYTQKSGDFDVKVKVPYLDVVRSFTKAGFLVRRSLDPFDQMVSANLNPMWPGSNRSEGSRRDNPNVTAVGWGNNPTYNLAWYPDAWLRLRRVGNTFLRYSSTNGVNWLFDGQTSIILPETLYQGVVVSAQANNNIANAQFDSLGDFAGYPGATIAIVTQPASFTINAGSSYTDTIVATVSGGSIPASAGELAYLWQRNDGSGNWTNLLTAGATNNTVAIGPLFITDNGAQFRSVLRAPGATEVVSSTFTATVNDTAVPTVASSSIAPGWSVNSIVITFAEPVSPITATNAANYSVTNSAGFDMGVASVAFLGADPRTVVITTVSPLVADRYGVVINNVQDLNGLTIAANTLRTIVQQAAAPGAPVVVEYYHGLQNTPADITTLTGNIKYTQDTPDLVVYSNVFGINPLNANLPDTFNNYGVKMFTYFVPPTSGAYKFYIRADDYAQFLMNTNATDSVNPAGAVLQYSLTGAQSAYAAARSVTNTLVGGQAYYMELRFKETTGGDGGTVAVRTDNTVPGQGEVIPGTQCLFPAALVKPTPVVVELYTGYQGRQTGNGQIDQLITSTNFPGSSYITDTINYNYIANTPPVYGYSRYFGYNTNLSQLQGTFDNYVGRLMSYFVAPSTGLYKFYIRSDDSSQLWMNTNAVNSTDPAGKSLLGQLGASTAAQTLVAQNVSLVGGQKYYLEGLWREGGGGDGMTVAVRSQGDAAVPTAQDVIPGNLLELPTPLAHIGAVSLTSIVPANPTVSDGQSITLAAAGIGGAPPYGTIWLRDGVQVLWNSITNITPNLTLADNGTVYTLVVTNLFSRVERSTTVTVLADTTAPTVVRTVGWRYNDGFTLEFSEALDPTSATFLANYQVSGGLRILSATLDPTRRNIVSLQTVPQAMNTTYTVTINGVKDASSTGNTIAATATTFSTWSVGGNGLMVELWTNIIGGAIADLTGQPKFQANLPDVTYYTNTFGVGRYNENTGLENYGARVSGYFVPTNTALYRFYTRSDDASQIWMNINSTDSENPAGRTMLVHQPGANQNMVTPLAQSVPVALTAGQRYYIEGLLKEGTGGDYLLVAFRECDANGTALAGTPADAATSIAMAGSFGGVPGNPDLVQITGTPPPDLTVFENDLINLVLTASVPPSHQFATTYQWQKFDGAAFTNIPGATASNLSFFVPFADDGARYKILFSAPGRSDSYITTLHVMQDTTAPYVVSASSLNGTNIDLTFNENVDPVTGADYLSYTINDGSLIYPTAAVIKQNGLSVTLTLSESMGSAGTPFSVSWIGVQDTASFPNASDGTTNGYVQGFVPEDVGAPPGAGSSFSSVPNEIDVIAGGADIWNVADQGHFTLTPRSGDFDIWARVQSLSRAAGDADGITKGGLMVRQSISANSIKVQYLAEPPASIGGRDRYEDGQRPTVGAATAAWTGGAAVFTPAGMPNAWMRIKRTGNLFTSFRSVDGTNWIQATTDLLFMTDPVLVGLATTAHVPAPSASTTLAQYRDIHIPLPPVILTQPTPADQTVGLGASISYSVVASSMPNSGTMTYQWFRNGSPLPGQNSATLSLPGASVIDSGTYTVKVANDGGATFSAACLLVVTNDLPVVVGETNSVVVNGTLSLNVSDLLLNDQDPEANPLSVIGVSGMYPVTVATNFDEGTLANSTLYFNAAAGAGTWNPTLGVNGSGGIVFTPVGVGSAESALVIDELTPGKRVSAFTASFKLRFSDPSAQAADGFSFNFAPNLVNGTAGGENGVGTGFSFCYDAFQFVPLNIGAAYTAPGGSVAYTSGLKLNYNGIIIAGVQIPTWLADRYVPVSITVSAEGVATVLVDGTNVFGNIVLPNYAPSQGRFGLYGRTGGQYMSQRLDDLSITVLTADTALDCSLNGTRYGNARTADGFLHLTDAVVGQSGSFIVNELTPGVNVKSFTADFKLRIGQGSGNAADGFSLNFASDLPNAAAGATGAEEGVGTGLSLCVRNYPTGGPGAPAVKVKWAGVELGAVLIPKWNNASFIPVSINLQDGGALTVNIDGTNVVTAFPTGYAPTAGRFGFFARTGGEYETHWVDDVAINVVDVNNAAGQFVADFTGCGSATVGLTNGVVTYLPPADACGVSDTFYYLVSDGQLGGAVVDSVRVNLTCGGAPMLSVGQVTPGGDLVLAWPDTGTGTLYQTTSLATPISWTPVAVTPILVNGQWVATIPAPSVPTFYVLRNP